MTDNQPAQAAAEAQDILADLAQAGALPGSTPPPRQVSVTIDPNVMQRYRTLLDELADVGQTIQQAEFWPNLIASLPTDLEARLALAIQEKVNDIMTDPNETTREDDPMIDEQPAPTQDAAAEVTVDITGNRLTIIEPDTKRETVIGVRSIQAVRYEKTIDGQGYLTLFCIDASEHYFYGQAADLIYEYKTAIIPAF